MPWVLEGEGKRKGWGRGGGKSNKEEEEVAIESNGVRDLKTIEGPPASVVRVSSYRAEASCRGANQSVVAVSYKRGSNEANLENLTTRGWKPWDRLVWATRLTRLPLGPPLPLPLPLYYLHQPKGPEKGREKKEA